MGVFSPWNLCCHSAGQVRLGADVGRGGDGEGKLSILHAFGSCTLVRREAFHAAMGLYAHILCRGSLGSRMDMMTRMKSNGLHSRILDQNVSSYLCTTVITMPSATVLNELCSGVCYSATVSTSSTQPRMGRPLI